MEGAEEGTHEITWQNSILGRKAPMAKAPRGASLVSWVEASVVGDKWVRERGGGGDITVAKKSRMCRAPG